MRANNVTITLHHHDTPTHPPHQRVWHAHAHLDGLDGHSPECVHAATAIGAALDQLAVEVAHAEVPELPELANTIWRLTYGRTTLPTVHDNYALLDRVCRICDRINAHRQRRLLITLLDDALDTREHIDLGQRINTAFHKTDLLTDTTPSPPAPQATAS